MKLWEEVSKFFRSFLASEIQDIRIDLAKNYWVDSSYNYLENEAIVEQVIEPLRRGRVSFRGSYWFARCKQGITLFPGQMVYVVGIDNLTLVVEPVASQIS